MGRLVLGLKILEEAFLILRKHTLCYFLHGELLQFFCDLFRLALDPVHLMGAKDIFEEPPHTTFTKALSVRIKPTDVFCQLFYSDRIGSELSRLILVPFH